MKQGLGGWIEGLLAATVMFAIAATGSAQQPPPSSPYQQMLDDYRTLDGSILGLSGAQQHFKASLQAVLDQVARDQKAADDRLAWVLDNWVPKQPEKVKP